MSGPVLYVEVLSSSTHCRWMNTNTAQQEYATLTKFCTLCTELQKDAASMVCGLFAAKIPRLSNSLQPDSAKAESSSIVDEPGEG